jgi:hypothetical protein
MRYVQRGFSPVALISDDAVRPVLNLYGSLRMCH